ncbi:MAG: hypothetical protein K6T65_08315 [Peptococcaceae bacterium]|nr:hypothetical protein [Peptococcaceae bacterium]
MLKKISVFSIILTLLAGFYFFPPFSASADDDGGGKLRRLLQAASLPAEIHGLQARLDRDQLVYGLPTDIPDNDWKPAPTSWEKDNGISLGHPGNQEPRYLGKTADWGDFSNDWFPDDAPNQTAPARRDIIAAPWKKGLTQGDNRGIPDITWGVIKSALQTYHRRIGFTGPADGFARNPAFQGDFDKVRDCFKVLAEPRPGLAGAVRHWHVKDGSAWYDTITVKWDILPNFIVESIDPGTRKAEAGQTYTGKVVLKAVPDASFLSDPLTSQLFDAIDGRMEIARECAVPFGVAVNGRLVPVEDFEPVAGLENIYQYKVPAGTTEDRREFTFQWTAPQNPGNGKIILAAGVNESVKVLPREVWGHMDWSEITNVDNVKMVEVNASQCDLSVKIIPDETEFWAFDGDDATVSYIVRVTRKDGAPGDIGVDLTVSDPAGPKTETFTTGGGCEEIPFYFSAGAGSYTVRAEAWPAGAGDAYPVDNRDAVTIAVRNKNLNMDGKIRGELIDN